MRRATAPYANQRRPSFIRLRPPTNGYRERTSRSHLERLLREEVEPRIAIEAGIGLPAEHAVLDEEVGAVIEAVVAVLRLGEHRVGSRRRLRRADQREVLSARLLA